MKIEQIIYFVKIARTQSITKAAEQLHISQPAISVAVSDLEAELGIKLFNRSRQGTMLTESGKRLLVEAEKVLQAWENLKTQANVEGHSMRGGLSLSVVPSLNYSFVPRLVQSFKEQFPLIDISLYGGGSDLVIKDVLSGKAQIGFITNPRNHELGSQEYVVERLFSATTVTVANNEFFKKVGSRRVKLRDLADYPMLTFTSQYSAYAQLNDRVKALGKGNGVVAVENHMALQQFCLQGMGIGFSPDMVAYHSPYVQSGDLHVIEVEDLGVSRDYACIYLKSLPLSTPLQKLLGEVRQLADEYSKTDAVRES
jgi:DNA-binding transcriptional LysR family regulator